MILCCGESLIDMLPRTTTEGGSAFAPHVGGSVFNTAIALGRLGAPSGYFGGLSDDLFGQMLVESLEASKVDISRAPRSSRPTTLAFVTLTDGNAEYAFYDENTANRMLTPEEMPDTDDCAALLFGCISLVAEPVADVLAALCAREAGRRPIMIDPNIRPGFVTDEARYRARLNNMLAVADIVKASDEDMDWMGTTPEALREMGVALVLVTRGAEGVDAYGSDGHIRVSAHAAQVVDTVGAGDTFNAGLLAGLHRSGQLDRDVLRNASLEELRGAVDLGARSAAVTVSRAGANPPWADEL